MTKSETPMATSTAIQILTNSGLKLGAANDHIVNGAPMNQPNLVSAIAIDPDPEIDNDLAAKVASIADSVETLYNWAQSN